MAHTAQDVINETKRYLLSGHREQYNRLANSCDAVETALVFDNNLGSLQEGAMISIGLELLYVWAVNPSSKTATVERGMFGSLAAIHAADSMVTVNPKFPDFSIFEAINSEIDNLSVNGLFKINTAVLTYVGGQNSYDLIGATNVLDALEAKYEYPGSTKDWPQLSHWKIQRNADATVFPSGFTVALTEVAQPGRPMRFTYSSPLVRAATTGSDMQTFCGLPGTANDLPALGAALRLQSMREVQRNFNDAQPDPRRAQEVPAGAQITSMRGIQDQYARRLVAEARRLVKLYPYRKPVI